MLQPQRPTPSSPWVWTLLIGALGLAAVALLALPVVRPPSAQALESDMHAARTRYPGIVGTQLNHCSLCHITDTNFHLDPYGRDYNNQHRDFAAIEGVDSDGDGFTNLVEINARTFPGKADSFPTATVTATPTQAVTATVTLTPVATHGPTATSTGVPTHVPTHGPTPAATHTPLAPKLYLYLPRADR